MILAAAFFPCLIRITNYRQRRKETFFWVGCGHRVDVTRTSMLLWNCGIFIYTLKTPPTNDPEAGMSDKITVALEKDRF